MWKKRHVIGISILFFMLVCPNRVLAEGNCRDVEQHVCEAARQLIKQKENAVNSHHLDLYLKTIDPDNQMYQQEQKRWFQDAARVIDPNSFHLQIRLVKPDGNRKICVITDQKYSVNGQVMHYQIPIILRQTKQGWKDADLSFEQLGNDLIVVYYTDSSLEMKAQIAYHTLRKAVDRLQKKFDWQPKKIEVKLYHHPEWFHQSVKPSLPKWAGGWHEARQSIKLVASGLEPTELASGMIHELTHQMVSDLTNDNAAYWLQEGAAMYYEAHLIPELQIKHHVDPIKEWTLSELEKKRLEKLPAQKARQYYLNSYAWYKKLVTKYGEQGFEKLFAYLKKFPYIDEESDQKRVQLNQRTCEALSEVFHVLTP